MNLLNRLFCLTMWVPAHQAAMAARPFPLAGTWQPAAVPGLMMIDANGRYTLLVGEERHYGRLAIDEPSRMLTFLPAQGAPQEQRYELAGDELRLRVAQMAHAPQSVWRRAA